MNGFLVCFFTNGHYHCDCVGGGVADADRPGAQAKLCGDFLGGTVQLQEGFTLRARADFNLLPAYGPMPVPSAFATASLAAKRPERLASDVPQIAISAGV